MICYFKNMKKFKYVLICICIFGCGAASAENYDMSSEILRLKKELAAARSERLHVKDDILKDKKEFEIYVKRSSDRKTEFAAETDSVKKSTKAFDTKKDSLYALAGDLSKKNKEYELLQNDFREYVIDLCNVFYRISKNNPPAVSKQTTGAVTFLINDCKTGSVDNVEAVHRLFQIYQNMEEATGTIQTGQEVIVPPEFHGEALMLRIGVFFEAIVDNEGKTGALWHGNDSTGQPIWQMVTDNQTAADLLKAVNIRESKALPALIALPYIAAGKKVAK